jgi:hypothetical protein
MWPTIRRHLLLLLLAILLVPAASAHAQDALVVRDLALREVIGIVERETGYRFLYRDALIAGVRLSLISDRNSVFEVLGHRLEEHGIGITIDAGRKQVMLFRLPRGLDPPRGRPDSVSGYVVDADDGSRLPFASVVWWNGDVPRGTMANEAGYFVLRLPEGDGRLTIQASHLGYQPLRVSIDAADPPGELVLRLHPRPIMGPEVVVRPVASTAVADTLWEALLGEYGLTSAGGFSLSRTLELLAPAALGGGTGGAYAVRGSRADGLMIVLDGMPVYNPDHLLGLFDAFNPRSLQAVSFHYDVPPAYLPAPPGGMLTLGTRTGSQTRVRGSVALSDHAVHATAETPLHGRRGSLLVGVRRSLLDVLPGRPHDAIVAFGLDVERPSSQLPSTMLPLINRERGNLGATFFDAHGRYFREASTGRRIMINAYLGGDQTWHEGLRFEDAATGGARRTVSARTENTWGHMSGSASVEQAIGRLAHSTTLIGASRYEADYNRTDFPYVRTLSSGEVVSTFQPFSHENELIELKASQRLDLPVGRNMVSMGGDIQFYSTSYREESIRWLHRFAADALLTEAFLHVDGPLGRRVTVHGGVRAHHYSQGNRFRISPRLQLRAHLSPALSVHGGFSRQHQFLHRLFLPHVASSGVWIPSTFDQPPTEADQVSAGIVIRPDRASLVRVDVYQKWSRYLRQHESLTFFRTPTGVAAGGWQTLFDPWYFDHTGESRALEVTARRTMGPLFANATYTWARTELRHPDFSSGMPYPADNDRRHRGSLLVGWRLADMIEAQITGHLATGRPNRLSGIFPAEEDRFPGYRRVDFGVLFRPVPGSGLELRLGGYNVLGHRNVWYRMPVSTVEATSSGRRPGLQNVDVYDIGRRFSAELVVALR